MDIVTLALAKKYTKDTAIQFGAVKGAPCKVVGSSVNEDGDTVLELSWENDEGEKRRSFVVIRKGTDGISIKSVEVDEENHLIIEYSNGDKLDAGYIEATDKLSEDLIATVSIGTVTPGKKYEKGTTLETIIKDILIKTENPVGNISLVPSTSIYDIVNDEVNEITIHTTLTRKTYDISKLQFYVGSTLLKEVTTGISKGGSFECSYKPETPIKATTTFKIVVTDTEGNTGGSSTTINFVANSYYGIVESIVGEPTEAIIKTLNKNLKTTKGFVYKNIYCDYNKIVYAYPTTLGALSYIKDKVNNFTYYPGSFTRTTINVDGIPYYVYTQNDASAAENVELTFE
jgi:hypothetical protein